MANQVLYRKYRPFRFEGVAGQRHVVDTLKGALKGDSVAHAYLFCGPRGTGKTTMARLLARYTNCVGRLGDDKTALCNESALCINCSAFAAANHPDLIEIDAASNRGIDEIRALKEGIRFAPVQAPYKFFIIDEAHMLTKEAFNALLKTLEEPPAHAIFVLATTEAHKVPATIASRCQRFDFARLTLEEIKNRLAWIAAQEGISADGDALALIARSADGSARDAESMLHQVMAYEREPITRELVATILGLIELPFLREFVDALAAKNSGQALTLLDEAGRRGIDMEQLVKTLTSYLRDVLLLVVNPDIAPRMVNRIGQEQLAAVQAQAQGFTQESLTRAITRFLEAHEQIKFAPDPALPIELAVVELLNN